MRVCSSLRDAKVMFRLAQMVFEVVSVGVWVYNRVRFRALASPFRVVQVPVSQIKRSIESSRYVHGRWYRISGTVRMKDWDRLKLLPKKHDELVQAFEGGIEKQGWFSDTRHRQRQDDAGGSHRLQWQGELRRYAAMYHDFRAGQFRIPQRWGSSVDPFFVCIGADGEFIFTTGKHRLALAKVAGLKSIPARISARHVKWQKLRESVASDLQSGVPSSEVGVDLAHPDFSDIIEKVQIGSTRL